MRLSSRRQRQRLLGEAFEQGLCHFDVARMYGLGLAEAELGRFARGRRDRVTIATKFGIDPPNPSLARLQAPARAALAGIPKLRSALERASSGPREPRRYDAAAARRSLEVSLRELGTDHVDHFFIHDPGPQDSIDLEGLGELFEELRARGLVGACGISGEPDPCIGLARAGAGEVLQVRDEILAPVLDARSDPEWAIGFGVLSRPMQAILKHLAGSPDRVESWRSRLSLDCTRPEVLSALLLQDALERKGRGIVLFGTSRRARIGPAVAAARNRDEAKLRAFRACVAEALPAPEPLVA